MRSRPAIALAVLTLAMAGSTAAAAESAVTLLPARVFTGLVVDPSPMPSRGEGRVPVSLRLTNTLWSADDSHLPAATQVRFDLDNRFRFDMARVPICDSRGGRDVRTGESPCEVGEIASGPIQFEVAFPGEAPVKVGGQAVAYKIGPQAMMIWSSIGAPVVAEVLVPVKIERLPAGAYGVRATASIPAVAGGNASLIYLGLRFRRGLFSAACPKRRLQFRVTNTLADGTAASEIFRTAC
jgi:hypothetical protein